MTLKQQRFVAEYLKDGNATQAAIRAGYSAKTAKQIGSRLLTFVDVQAAVVKIKAEVQERAVASLVPWADLVPEVQTTLRQVADGTIAKGGAVRVMAANAILDRAMGKPPAKLQVSGRSIDDELEALDLTPQQATGTNGKNGKHPSGKVLRFPR